MTYLLIALTLLTIWHLIWQRALLPSFRQQHRYRLFELRDNLRAICSSDISAKERKAAEVIHNGLNSTINNIEGLTLSLEIKIHLELLENGEFKKRSIKRAQFIKDCGNPEIIEIYNSANKTVRRIFDLNSAGWTPYLIPIVLVVALHEKTKKIGQSYFTAPGHYVDKLTA